MIGEEIDTEPHTLVAAWELIDPRDDETFYRAQGEFKDAAAFLECLDRMRRTVLCEEFKKYMLAGEIRAIEIMEAGSRPIIALTICEAE